jgi:hypothetical protein
MDACIRLQGKSWMDDTGESRQDGKPIMTHAEKRNIDV